MKISRKSTLLFHYLLDQLTPPILRDADWFMLPMFRFLFGKKSSIFAEWKQKAPGMSAVEFTQTYRAVEDVLIERETSLNPACLDAIKASVLGESILEVGCGNGYLAGILSQQAKVTGVDILVSDATRLAHPQVEFREGNMERLPFEPQSFDTVVSTHTLEHVQNVPAALHELRRVARRRLILVTPKQRPYRYTFDLHLNFFPYPHSLLQAVGKGIGPAECRVAGGDLFYLETRPED